MMTHGWDNVMCRIGDGLAARLPRRAMAVKLLLHEQRSLPVLAPRLPLPVPVPLRIGRPGLGYPWPWSIVPFLPGRPAAQNPPTDLRDAAVSLGRFLAALHAPAPPNAPVNPFRGIPLADRVAKHAESLALLGGRVDRDAVVRLWHAALAVPAWDGPPLWLHGDLHPANILVHRGRVSAVIDFGDVTSGDPAGDLSIAWMLLPAEDHKAFQDAYRATATYRVDDACWARAKGWALTMSLVYLANSADNALIASIGQRTLSAVLA
jgi:aminoglycoside phosphotransferase (APT) family kinase protein